MDPAQTIYWQKMAYKLAMVFIVVGALNWGLIGAFKFNLVEKLFGKGLLARTVYLIVGISALTVLFCRDFYLPFLGQTLVPCAAIKEKVPDGASVMINVRVEPGQKVLYWATEPATAGLETLKTWNEAYLGYENAGVTVADEKGNAVLKVRPPQAYTVPFKGRLEPHVHYRVCLGNGFLGRVETVPVSVKEGLYRWG